MVHGHRWLIGTLVVVALAVAVALLAAGGQASLADNGTIYVDAEAASGNNDGTSWADAYTTLQPALADAEAGQQIWVAAGVYRPTWQFDSDPRSATFQMKNGVAIYGGFDPSVGDTEWEHRDWEANPTILSGDLNGDDGPDTANNDENSYHVFYHPDGTNLDSTAILDGFTITGGNANGGGYSQDAGGGMYNDGCSPALTNCAFTDNSATVGGGMYSRDGSAPTLTKVTFSGNSADYGGGMYNVLSSPALTDCTFSGNAAAYHSGGMGNSGFSSPTLTDCTFDGNTAGFDGGGMSNGQSSPTLTNCLFINNVADSDGSGSGDGGGMSNGDSSPVLSGTHFLGNTANNGGGMHNGNGSNPELTNVSFGGNTAAADGGGMHNYPSSSPALTNVTFIGNTAGVDGGGMSNGDSSPALTNVTFTRNTAADNGGGIYNWQSAPTLTNCILWGDTAGGLPEEICNSDSGSTPVVTYSDIQGGCGNIPGNDCGDGNIGLDPLFLDPINGDLRLQLTSPAIDAGNNDAPGLAGVTTDLAGRPRFADVLSVDDTGNGESPIVDMGAQEAPPDVIYVDQDATGGNDSASWDDAFTGLQPALAWAEEGVEIWVAEGTYTPAVEHGGSGDRYQSFQMANGVAIYGGFDPTVGATEFEDRDWLDHVTILSGDLNGDDEEGFVSNDENSYHVFYHPYGMALDASAILDGFTISGGNADADPWNGGGMVNFGSNPTLRNLTFSDNRADGHGGGMYNHDSSPTLTNCTFSGNTADGYGGGMSNSDSSPTLTNCTFSGNSAVYGGGMFNFEWCLPTLTNCILWGDAGGEIGGASATVTYSDIQGGYDGDGNIDADPLFVDAANGDFHLGPGSPCIDVGNNAAPDLPDLDFEGDARILDGDGDGAVTVDMGVDEVAAAGPGFRVYLPLVLRGY